MTRPRHIPSFAQRLERRLARSLLRLPDRWLRVLAGEPIVRDGLTLDTQTQFLLTLRRRAGKKAWQDRTVEQARRDTENDAGTIAPQNCGLMAVDDMHLGGVPVRLYRPAGLPSPAPVLLFVHGGGFVLGSLDSHDGPCRWLAEAAQCVVFGVDYRLAPEAPFPAAVDDSLAVFRALAAQAAALGFDPARLAVGGDSAGGNLAAVIAQQTRDDAIRPCFQLLFYPWVDAKSGFPSIRIMNRGFFLEAASIAWCRSHYLGPGREQDGDPRASPLYGDLAGLPPALVQTAGFDPLRDEGEAYAEALRKASVAVESQRYDGLIHGYLNMAGGLRSAQAPLQAAAAALRRAFGSS